VVLRGGAEAGWRLLLLGCVLVWVLVWLVCGWQLAKWGVGLLRAI
jgi:hypothetical protein